MNTAINSLAPGIGFVKIFNNNTSKVVTINRISTAVEATIPIILLKKPSNLSSLRTLSLPILNIPFMAMRGGSFTLAQAERTVLFPIGLVF
jgi:hypothetical protein